MQEKRRGFPNWGYVLLGALAFAGFYFVRNMGQKTILKAVLGEPANLINKSMSSARVSPRITSRTGHITSKNFKVEKLGATKDSLSFRFFLDGERADATVRLWMARRPSGEWQIVKSDTVFTE
ncbi:hypothetical protein KBK19_10655 [Microvirga sp. STR05]|uniref:DUF4878 domain-containing protein n=1 Tax=Hymenobacter duratus TaxID=2771356 RepID=A0ABR8JID9_9BACT|nr:hypothetical protein [Hymenobacter duratus]MBD2715496.1 hypothetical protein [Hymenobacter duratus]MBR7950404.1 hypothetical protein [Microvirga sp. STR05]